VSISSDFLLYLTFPTLQSIICSTKRTAADKQTFFNVWCICGLSLCTWLQISMNAQSTPTTVAPWHNVSTLKGTSPVSVRLATRATESLVKVTTRKHGHQYIVNRRNIPPFLKIFGGLGAPFIQPESEGKLTRNYRHMFHSRNHRREQK